MAVLTAYFDDSGTHEDSSTVVVAGLISTPEKWVNFTREWKKARAEYRFTHFHFAELLANQKGSSFEDQRRWNDPYKTAVLIRLRRIIYANAIRAFSISVNRKEYDECFSPEQKAEFGNHFTWGVRGLLGRVEQWRLDNNIQEPIEFIFSNMTGKPRREIDGLFDGALKITDSLHKFGITPGCHSFRDMREFLPLQASDLLAGCVYRADKHRIRKVDIPPFVADTYNYFTLKTSFFDNKYQTREALEVLAANNPHLLVPEDRTAKPTPRGTRPKSRKQTTVL